MKEVKITKVNETRSKAQVQFSKEEIQEMEKEAITKIKKTAKVDGFRKGKVPDNIIRQKFKEQIARNMYELAIHIAVPKVGEASDEGLYSVVSMDDINLGGDSPEISFTFDLPPVVKIKKLKDIQIKEHIPEISEQDLKKEINNYLYKESTFVATDEPPQDLDRILADYEVWVNDIPQGNEEKNQTFHLGRGELPEKVETEMKNRPAKKGEEFTLEEERKNPDGTDVTVKFFFTVQSIEKAVLPELNDEFTKRVDPAYETVEIFKEKVKSDLEKKFKRLNIGMELKEALNKLVDQVEFHFSESHINDEQKNILKQYQISEIPKENEEDFQKSLIQGMRNEALGRHLHNMALQESGKSVEEELKEVVTREFGAEAANIGVQMLTLARTNQQPEGYAKQILDSYLQLLATDFNFRFFQKEGVVKKGKKMSFEELDGLYHKEAK